MNPQTIVKGTSQEKVVMNSILGTSNTSVRSCRSRRPPLLFSSNRQDRTQHRRERPREVCRVGMKEEGWRAEQTGGGRTSCPHGGPCSRHRWGCSSAHTTCQPHHQSPHCQMRERPWVVMREATRVRTCRLDPCTGHHPCLPTTAGAQCRHKTIRTQ